MPLTFPDNPQIGQTVEYSFPHSGLAGQTGDEVTRLWTWNGPTMGWVSNGTRQLDYITRTEAIDIFVNESGDTMTGTLIGTDINLSGSLSADKGFRQSSDTAFQDNEFITKLYTDLLTPAGIIFPYGGDAAPDGYLLCDGSSYSRTTYSRLFGIIGTKYGEVNSETFKVPDFRGRSPIGGNPSVIDSGNSNQRSVRQLGEFGGTETNILEAQQLPKHEHRHTLRERGPASDHDCCGVVGIWRDDTFALTDPDIYDADGNLITQQTGVNNMMPYQVVNYIIKF